MPATAKGRAIMPVLAALSTTAWLGTPAASAAPDTVYAETNQPNNELVVLARGPHDTLRTVQRISTGGIGSTPNPPFNQNQLDANNEIELTHDRKLLFAVNAGDNTVSAFRVDGKGLLALVDVAPTNGEHPVSVDSSGDGKGGLVYVLNEVDRSGNDLTGFTYDKTGHLTPIPGSTRSLATPFSDDNGFGVAEPLADQVLFSPDGSLLTVPERGSNGFRGQIDTFPVNADGTLGPVTANASNDYIPFGLAWDPHGHLIAANAGSPFADPAFFGSGSSYARSGSTLTSISVAQANAVATCWVAIAKNGKYAYMTDQNSALVSRFSIDKDGTMALLENVASSGFGADMALNHEGDRLYVLDIANANGNGGALIDTYKVKGDGKLEFAGVTDPGIPDSASGLAAD